MKKKVLTRTYFDLRDWICFERVARYYFTVVSIDSWYIVFKYGSALKPDSYLKNQ